MDHNHKYVMANVYDSGTYIVIWVMYADIEAWWQNTVSLLVRAMAYYVIRNKSWSHINIDLFPLKL